MHRSRHLSPAGDGPLVNRKAFTRADVIRVAAPLLYGRDPANFDRLVRTVVHHVEAIPLVGQPFARGRHWAAASVLATEVADRERRLGARLTAGQARAIAAVTRSALDC